MSYDSFRINDDLIDACAETIQHLEAHHFTGITRSTTSAFMRRGLGEELRNRNMAPHVFESRDEAQAFLASHSGR